MPHALCFLKSAICNPKSAIFHLFPLTTAHVLLQTELSNYRVQLNMEVALMGSLKFNPTEMWDEHNRKLRAIESKMQQTEVFLESVKEKRASPRIRSLLLASYVPRKGEQQEYIISIGRTLDVSEGGAKIETHRQLEKGLQLELEIAVEDQIISAKGEVLYSQELRDGLFGTGISFTAINEEARRLLRS